MAVDRDYAHADPAECRARFRQGRAGLLTTLRGLTPPSGSASGRTPKSARSRWKRRP